MTLSATEKRKRPVEAGGRSSRILAAMILVSALIAVRLRRQAAAAGRPPLRRRSRSRSRSNAPSPIGMNSPAGSRRSRKCRSAPASAASSPASSSATAPSSMPAICSTSSIRARSRRSPMQADGQLSDARAKAELAKRELDRALTLVQTSAVSESIVDQRRQTLQAAHAAEMQAEGALKAAQAQYRIHPCDGADRRPRQPPSRQRRQSRAGQRRRLDAADLDRLARSDLHLFRRRRGDLSAEQPALVRRQAAEFARYAESGAGDADRRNQAVA